MTLIVINYANISNPPDTLAFFEILSCCILPECQDPSCIFYVVRFVWSASFDVLTHYALTLCLIVRGRAKFINTMYKILQQPLGNRKASQKIQGKYGVKYVKCCTVELKTVFQNLLQPFLSIIKCHHVLMKLFYTYNYHIRPVFWDTFINSEDPTQMTSRQHRINVGVAPNPMQSYIDVCY